MRVGISILVDKTHGYATPVQRKAMFEEALDGRVGMWLKMHGLLREAQLMESAMFIVFDCDESQYMECLLAFDGIYQVEIITR